MPWLAWTIAASFMAYQFILRLLPGLIMHQLMTKFQIDASDYGLLSSMYYFGYAGAQLPVAYCLDRFGPRWVISICIFLCSLSTLLLAHSPYWGVVLIARFLIGVGSAAGFLGTAKVISQWFDGKYYGRMLGVTFSYGFLGAVYGGKPVANWLTLSHWESVMDSIACLGMGLGIMVILFLRSTGFYERPQERPQLADIWQIITDKKLILLGVCNLLMVGALEGFADVWGIPFLMKAYVLEKGTAALLTSIIFIGMLFGGPILAFIAEKTSSFLKTASAAGILSALLMFSLLLALRDSSLTLLMVLMFLLGILGCYQVLILTMGSFIAPPALLGMTSAFLNCINMLGGAFFHSIIGFILDFTWEQGLEDGIRVYSVQSFKLALLIIPVASLLGSVGLLVTQKVEIKATHHGS